MIHRLLAVCCLLLVPLAGFAQDEFEAHQFRRDLQILEKEVFEPLSQELSAANDDVDWYEYLKRMLDRIRTLRAKISPITYGLVRDASTTLGQNFSEYNRDGSWRDAAYYIDTTLDLIGRVLFYQEACESGLSSFRR